MAILEFIFILALAGIGGILLLRANATNQKQQRLQRAFYQLLKAQDSCISLIQLAAAAEVDPAIAREFLDQQVRTFSAFPEVDREGDTFYRFPKLRLPPSLAEENW
jgi:hypothetical protein